MPTVLSDKFALVYISNMKNRQGRDYSCKVTF